jgi:very-short-patch-repair endonuclease
LTEKGIIDDIIGKTVGEIEVNRRAKKWHTDAVLWIKLKSIAKEMRRKPTEAEDLLWQRLRKHQLLGFKFRRQHSIERFIVDFYCAEARVVLEIDGSIHQYREEEDLIRQDYIKSLGLRLLRFSNNDVLNNLDEVLEQITRLGPPPESL